MYGLRTINNQYKDFAGTRSDFVVVGHPEFCLGKQGSNQGYDACWDQTQVRMRPARNIARDRSFQKLVADVSSPKPWQTLKEKALERRSRSAASLSSPCSPGYSSGQSSPARSDGFDQFIKTLSSEKGPPTCKLSRASGGYSNHMRSLGPCKHYADMDEHIADIRRKLEFAPDATREELKSGDTWKYYALHLEQANRLDTKRRRQQGKAMAITEKAVLASSQPLRR